MSRKNKYIYHQVIQVKQILDDRYMEQINVEEVLWATGFSNYNFIRLFKALYSLPPHQYLAQLKVQSAKYELINSELLIAEISQNLGFKDKEGFIRTFILFTGQTPTQYRKLHQTISRREDIYSISLEKIFAFTGRQVAGLLSYQGITSASYH